MVWKKIQVCLKQCFVALDAVMAGPVPIKCVVLGPPRSGKSSMLLNLTTGETSDECKEYWPTIFDNYATSIEHQGQTYELR